MCITAGARVLPYCLFTSSTCLGAFWENIFFSITPEPGELGFFFLIIIINGNSIAILEFLHVENIKQVLAAIKSELLTHSTVWMDLILNALSNCVELFSQLI